MNRKIIKLGSITCHVVTNKKKIALACIACLCFNNTRDNNFSSNRCIICNLSIFMTIYSDESTTVSQTSSEHAKEEFATGTVYV